VSRRAPTPPAPARRPGVGARSFNRKAASQKTRGPQQRRRELPSLDPRPTLRKVPLTAWLCGLVALLNAVSWSIITPPFQGPDEQDHVTYVSLLAKENRLPTSTAEEPPREVIRAYSALFSDEITENPAGRSIATEKEQRNLEKVLSERPTSSTAGGAGNAGSEPPLYYALEAIPYTIASAGSLLARIALMRLLSALMAGITAVFAFLFLRETLPTTRWAWTVGGLGVALAPLLGFISGVVNPDAMLVAVASALFYLLARGFRRGLTRQLAVAIGVMTAIGFLTKLNFLGLAPGVFLGLVLLALRASRRIGRAAWLDFAIGATIALSPVLLYVVVNLFSSHPGLGSATGGIVGSKERNSFSQELSYIWQFYLPRLPGMHNYFPDLLTPVQIWFRGLIGKYGWLETSFPDRVYDLALIPLGLLSALCARELVRCRRVLRGQLGELLVYGAMTVGVMIVVGSSSYLRWPGEFGQFAEPRYLLPMAALGGAFLALAARGAGRRWGPPVGALIVILVLAHDIFSQLLVIGRYYGPL
jgi:Predicted membrane protein (DUF2142)